MLPGRCPGEKRAVPLPKPCVLWQTPVCQRLPPVPPQPPFSCPPPGVRISPKCWRSVTCMFNSFQKHRKAICRPKPREAGPCAAALRCAAPRLPSPLSPARLPPLGPGRPEPLLPACRTRVGPGDTKPAPPSPSPTRICSELKLLPPLNYFFFFPMSPVSSGKYISFSCLCRKLLPY